MLMLRRAFVAGMAALAIAFLSPTISAAQPASGGGGPARVFAASSMTDALNEIGRNYATTGHPAPVFNYASSSVLARQIDQGAHADVFISADEAWMDYLAERRLIDASTRTSFISNRLVLIAPANHPLQLQIGAGFPLLQALQGGKLAMGDPDSVPAGRYGRAALQNLGVWSSVAGSVVRAENVRAALRFVETGEAAAGVVYLTDALSSGSRVQIVGAFPEVSHPRISYPIAIVAAGGRSDEARAFGAYLQSDAAKQVFRRLGFIVQ